jgi:hypothetical protein
MKNETRVTWTYRWETFGMTMDPVRVDEMLDLFDPSRRADDDKALETIGAMFRQGLHAAPNTGRQLGASLLRLACTAHRDAADNLCLAKAGGSTFAFQFTDEPGNRWGLRLQVIPTPDDAPSSAMVN